MPEAQRGGVRPGDGPEGDAPPGGAAAAAGGSVAAVRAWRRAARPAPTLLRRLEPVYYVLLTLGIGGPFAYGTAAHGLAEVATPRAVAVWGPPLLLLSLLALVRWGAVQGPVVFALPDVAHLLGAPLPRAALVLRRLVRSLAIGAFAAAVVGALVVIGVAGDGRGIPAGRAAAFVVAAALLGLLGVTGAALVQGSRRFDAATRAAAVPLLLAAAVLAVVAHRGTTGRDVALWSGPWGWAAGTVLGHGVIPDLALLAVLTAAVLALALGRRGATPTERHLARAEARNGARAALMSFNARYVRRSLAAVGARPASERGVWRRGADRLRGAARRPAPGGGRAAQASAGGGAGWRLPAPASPGWAVPWRDAQAALARPGRAVRAATLAAAAALVMLLDAERPVAVGVGALGLFAAASLLLEPLRAETDDPARARALLRTPYGRVLAAHAVVPGAVVVAAVLLAAAGCAVAGALPPHGAAALVLVVVAAPAVTLCAALSSRRGGQLSPSVMAATYADPTGMGASLVLAWIVAWPLAALALGAVPVALVVAQGTGGLVLLLAVIAGACGALYATLRAAPG